MYRVYMDAYVFYISVLYIYCVIKLTFTSLTCTGKKVNVNILSISIVYH